MSSASDGPIVGSVEVCCSKCSDGGRPARKLVDSSPAGDSYIIRLLKEGIGECDRLPIGVWDRLPIGVTATGPKPLSNGVSNPGVRPRAGDDG